MQGYLAYLPYVNVGGAIFAALFWLISALVRVPDFLGLPLTGSNSVTGIMSRQSRWSAAAAICAAASALAQAAIPFAH